MVANPWMRYVYACVLLAGVLFAGATLFTMARSIGTPITRTKTIEVPQPAPTTVADAKARYDSEAIPGSEMGLPETCEGYRLSDGVGIVCAG